MRGFGGRPRKPLFAPRLVLATAGLWFLGMMSMGCGLFTCLIVIVGTLLRKRNPGPVSDEIPCRARRRMTESWCGRSITCWPGQVPPS